MTTLSANASALASTSGTASSTPAAGAFSAMGAGKGGAGDDFMSMLEAITGAMSGEDAGSPQSNNQSASTGLTAASGTAVQAAPTTAAATALASTSTKGAQLTTLPVTAAAPAGDSAGNIATPSSDPLTAAKTSQIVTTADNLAAAAVPLVSVAPLPTAKVVLPGAGAQPSASPAGTETATPAQAVSLMFATPAAPVPAQAETTGAAVTAPASEAAPTSGVPSANAPINAAQMATAQVDTTATTDTTPASASPAPAPMDSAAAHQADNLLTSAAQGGNDGSTLLQPAAGQKLPAGTAKTTSVAADPTKTALDSNALTQAAALTVIATPLVVPAVAAIPAKTGAAALDAQFSVFTSKPASPGSTDPKTAALASDEDNDNDGETDADSDSVSDKFSADVQDAAPMLVQDNGASDGFGGQNKFSNELTQVLSLVQAGVTQPEKETGRGNATDTTSPATGTDTILSSAGLTLTKQDSGQGLVTSFAPATATAATPQTIYKAPADQVSLTLQRAAASQNSSMTINLNPAELGRVEVNLKFGKNGSVQANVMADKAGTLAMLKGDQTTLQQALQSAGLNPDSSSLSFSLRDDQAQSQQQPDSSASNSQAASAENGAGSDSQAASSTTQYAVQTTGNGHLNLFV